MVNWSSSSFITQNVIPTKEENMKIVLTKNLWIESDELQWTLRRHPLKNPKKKRDEDKVKPIIIGYYNTLEMALHRAREQIIRSDEEVYSLEIDGSIASLIGKLIQAEDDFLNNIRNQLQGSLSL